MKLKISSVQSSAATKWRICISLLPLITACGDTDSSVVREARLAEAEGRIIDNELMLSMYPKSFRKGHPKYLERDFEAGVNFMCDEFRAQYGKDVCAEPEIHWRR
ncbi:hypothetical protein MCEMIH15_01910 [Caulobacteraceae bacterium]